MSSKIKRPISFLQLGRSNFRTLIFVNILTFFGSIMFTAFSYLNLLNYIMIITAYIPLYFLFFSLIASNVQYQNNKQIENLILYPINIKTKFTLLNSFLNYLVFLGGFWVLSIIINGNGLFFSTIETIVGLFLVIINCLSGYALIYYFNRDWLIIKDFDRVKKRILPDQEKASIALIFLIIFSFVNFAQTLIYIELKSGNTTSNITLIQRNPLLLIFSNIMIQLFVLLGITMISRKNRSVVA